MAEEIEILPQETHVEVRFLGAYSLDGYRRRMALAGRNLNLLRPDIREQQDFTPSTMERCEQLAPIFRDAHG